MPAKWTKARIKLGPSGEFHMPHRCACCCVEYGLEKTELKGLWVASGDKRDNIDIPIWYCVPCRRHIARDAFLARAVRWLSTASSVAFVCWVIIGTNWMHDPAMGFGLHPLAKAAIVLAAAAAASYAALRFLARIVQRRLDTGCGARHVAATLVRANASSKAGVLQHGFEIKLSNHEYARLLGALNHTAGAHVELV